MKKITSISLEMVMQKLESDDEYMCLEQQRQEKLAALQAVMERLTETQRDAIVDYIGIAEEQHWRAVEIFCK